MATGAALRCVLVASVVLGACATGAGQPLAGPRDASDRLAGTRYGWALSARGAGSAQCREEWSFGADGIMTIQSGRETEYVFRP